MDDLGIMWNVRATPYGNGVAARNQHEIDVRGVCYGDLRCSDKVNMEMTCGHIKSVVNITAERRLRDQYY
jgi:hypothetical protein